jgi:hypothetical protein
MPGRLRRNQQQLSRDNAVKALSLATDVDRRAVFNDTGQSTLGRIELDNLQVAGVIQLLAADAVRGGHVEAHSIDIVAADARGYDRRSSRAPSRSGTNTKIRL